MLCDTINELGDDVSFEASGSRIQQLFDEISKLGLIVEDMINKDDCYIFTIKNIALFKRVTDDISKMDLIVDGNFLVYIK